MDYCTVTRRRRQLRRRGWGQLGLAARYASRTEAGSEPRALTSWPFSHAHWRISFGSTRVPTAVLVPRRFVAVGFLDGARFDGRVALFAAELPSAVDSVTPYRLLMTRSTSASGSWESRVTFMGSLWRMP